MRFNLRRLMVTMALLAISLALFRGLLRYAAWMTTPAAPFDMITPLVMSLGLVACWAIVYFALNNLFEGNELFELKWLTILTVLGVYIFFSLVLFLDIRASGKSQTRDSDRDLSQSPYRQQGGNSGI